MVLVSFSSIDHTVQYHIATYTLRAEGAGSSGVESWLKTAREYHQDKGKVCRSWSYLPFLVVVWFDFPDILFGVIVILIIISCEVTLLSNGRVGSQTQSWHSVGWLSDIVTPLYHHSAGGSALHVHRRGVLGGFRLMTVWRKLWEKLCGCCEYDIVGGLDSPPWPEPWVGSFWVILCIISMKEKQRWIQIAPNAVFHFPATESPFQIYVWECPFQLRSPLPW